MSTQNEALRLADELEEAAGDYFQFDKHLGYDSAAELRRLKAENEELRKDAERLNFMASRGYYIGWNREGEYCRVFGIEDEEVGFEPLSGSKYFESARAAIDTAIAKQKGVV